MSIKHTPGKWLLNPLINPTKPYYYCLYVKPGDHKTIQHIAVISSDRLDNKEELAANARLICAAPEMLEVLLEAKGLLEDTLDGTDYFIYSKITNAINKATHETE